mgnify:FL=1
MTPTQSPTNPHAAGKAAHTEGSWHIGLAATERAVYGKYGEHIATLPDMLASDEVTANARLIAAAPELLEALQSILFQAGCREARDLGNLNYDRLHAVEAQARAAIARATGQGEGRP